MTAGRTNHTQFAAPAPCEQCGRNPSAVNNDWRECSHVPCPHRRTAWSERPTPQDFLHVPAKDQDGDPKPLDFGH